jgi:hypothetical protein
MIQLISLFCDQLAVAVVKAFKRFIGSFKVTFTVTTAV